MTHITPLHIVGMPERLPFRTIIWLDLERSTYTNKTKFPLATAGAEALGRLLCPHLDIATVGFNSRLTIC